MALYKTMDAAQKTKPVQQKSLQYTTMDAAKTLIIGGTKTKTCQQY